MNNMKLKTKDYIFLGIITALNTALYIIVTMSLYAIGTGPFVHTISPGIYGVIGGTVITFLSNKCGKKWVFTISSIIMMAIMSLASGAYLPWIITSIIGAIIADLICSKAGYTNKIALGVSYGFMQVGQALGGIIPVWFFVDSYIDTWVKRGMTKEMMAEMVNATKGIMGVYAVIVVFILSFSGVMIGSKILKKHFEKLQN